MRHRVAQGRHIVGRHLHLRRNNHRGFGCQLRILIAHHDMRRSDLFHRQLGQFALGRLEFVAIAATATAACLRLRRLQDRNSSVGTTSVTVLVRLGDLLDHASSQQRAANDQRQHHDVNRRRTQSAVLLVIVKAPDITDRNGLEK